MITKEQLRLYAANERRITNTKLRIQRFNEDPHCYYCHKEVFLYPEITNRDIKKREKYPADLATIEHLYDRLDPDRRYQVYEHFENRVLACFACNQHKAKEHRDALGNSYLEQRAFLLQTRKKWQSRALVVYGGEQDEI